MLHEFRTLTPEEHQLMLDAIPLITLLVAGADGHIDSEELEVAEKIAHVRSYDFNNELNEYFQLVSDEHLHRLNHYHALFPKTTAERQAAITEELAKLNPILSKMDKYDAAVYYKNFRTFAMHVAKAAGGVLGFMSIAKEEAKVVDLPMLTVFE
jgi:hypothetical protein